jgi:hypothetical protein
MKGATGKQSLPVSFKLHSPVEKPLEAHSINFCKWSLDNKLTAVRILAVASSDISFFRKSAGADF